MKISFVEYLRCPVTNSKLTLIDEVTINDRIHSGTLVSKCGLFEYSIINYIPRFVKSDNYANSFGWQWNKFKKTQFDSYSGHPITYNRFWNATNWKGKISNGEWILDAGCGSGRFAEISSVTEAIIVAIDYSNAVDACYENLGDRDNLLIIQCDIYTLPFEDKFFDKVYSLGVLQHTPDVKRAVKSLSLKVKERGFFCIDFYEKSLKSLILPKYWLRPFTKRIDKEKLLSILERRIDFLLKANRSIKKVPLVGKLFARLVPVADYTDILPLNEVQLKQWALLDTFDWLTPTYDNPQTKETINQWLIEFGFEKIDILREGHIVGRGIKV
jgi:SAM-dependent methyltransferase